MWWTKLAIGGLSGIAVLAAGGFVLAASGKAPSHLGAQQERLAPCPDSPNCVSSDADANDKQHVIPALPISGDRTTAWKQLQSVLADWPRCRIETVTDQYLHATVRSGFFGFVDDVECLLRDDHIAIRSASRVGHSDLGVNRARTEKIRRALRNRGVVR
jgi:uncharacterized protein (DUF1499 family)